MWLKSKKEIKKERTGHGGMLMALFPRFFSSPLSLDITDRHQMHRRNEHNKLNYNCQPHPHAHKIYTKSLLQKKGCSGEPSFWNKKVSGLHGSCTYIVPRFHTLPCNPGRTIKFTQPKAPHDHDLQLSSAKK